MATKGVNKVILLGNLGKDPETKKFDNGSVTKISIATSESWKDKNSGKNEERTEWHNVVFYGKLSDIASTYLGKGDKVYIEGSLRTRQWDKDGQKHYTTEIIASNIQMLGGNKASQDATNAKDYQNAKDGRHGYSGNEYDVDVPF